MEHPLTRLENVIWKLLIEIACHKITPEEAYNAFFADTTVTKILDEEPSVTDRCALCRF